MATARVSPTKESKKSHGRHTILESEICLHGPSRAKDTKRQFQVVASLFWQISEILEQVIKLDIRDAFNVDVHAREGLASMLATSGVYETVREAIDHLWEANDKLVDAARGLGAAHIYRVRRDQTPVAYPRKKRLVAICFQSTESAEQSNVVAMPSVEQPAAGPIPIPEGDRREETIASS